MFAFALAPVFILLNNTASSPHCIQPHVARMQLNVLLHAELRWIVSSVRWAAPGGRVIGQP